MHSNEATPEPPGSEPEKVKLAAALLVSAVGWVSIWVLGAAVSTVQVKVAGPASTLPAWSTARTSKLWEPSLRPLSSFGEEHAPHDPASSLHSKEATPEPPSLPVNSNWAEAELAKAPG